ncbi:MAG TPA: hypothetical protein VGG75_38145 [Trebonia sp.]
MPKHEEQRQCNVTWGSCDKRSLSVPGKKSLPHICSLWGGHRVHICDYCLVLQR